MVEAKRYGPVTTRVIDNVRNGIGSGEFSSRLPSYEEMAKMFGVARLTVREAIQVLQAEGLVQVRQGSGVYLVGTEARKTFNSEFIPDPVTLSEQLPPLPQLALQLRIYLLTQQQLAEKAYSEDPSPKNERDFIIKAGRATLLENLEPGIRRVPENHQLRIGIISVFQREAYELVKAPNPFEAAANLAGSSASPK